ncbi:MAG TPA: hypothetical protein EYQ86_01960, partial [Bacteroidetes bacterium]|nr:hypothetical protein [Bacteroidota bacterium]
MKNVSFKIRRFVVLMFTLFFIQSLQASHAVGMDISVTWIGPGNLDYEIKVSFYRDCSGSNAPGSLQVCYQSSSCGVSGSTLSMSQDPGTGQEISPICPSMNSRCSGGTLMGVQEYTYTETLTLPSACNDWQFSTSIYARNPAITTLNAPGTDAIWIYASLNNLDYPKNSTPVFKNKPVPFICANQPFIYNHGAIDPEGDQLLYSLITPMDAAGSNSCNSNGIVTYLGGYSAQQPILSTPPVSIDPVTGDVIMNPTQQEISVMAVLVEEFKNGVLSGSVVRDIQIVVEACTNTLPELTGINGTAIFTDTLCAGNTLCFDILSSDQDATQNLTLTWNQAISGGSFSSSFGQFPVGTFCWTPGISDTSSFPHFFTVNVEDDNCPY